MSTITTNVQNKEHARIAQTSKMLSELCTTTGSHPIELILLCCSMLEWQIVVNNSDDSVNGMVIGTESFVTDVFAQEEE